jgi:hypothetical protein
MLPQPRPGLLRLAHFATERPFLWYGDETLVLPSSMRFKRKRASMTLLPLVTPGPSSRSLLACVLALVCTIACQPEKKSQKASAGTVPSASASASASAVPASSAAAASSAAPGESEKPTAKEVRHLLATPVPQADIDKVINPKGLAPYAGPTGTISGVVKLTGDAPVEHADVLRAIASDCGPVASATYGKTPREGADRTVADVFVAVTGYDAFVPAKGPERVVRGSGCAWEARTIALMFGQTLRIGAGDNRAYVPDLLGQRMPAQLFAMPGAEPVSLPPRKPGRFTLLDSMRLYSKADVFVVPYPTFAVTGTDGKFEISGVPVGKVKVNALLPATMAVAEQEVTVKAGETAELAFSLAFDAKAFKALDRPVK